MKLQGIFFKDMFNILSHYDKMGHMGKLFSFHSLRCPYEPKCTNKPASDVKNIDKLIMRKKFYWEFLLSENNRRFSLVSNPIFVLEFLKEVYIRHEKQTTLHFKSKFAVSTSVRTYESVACLQQRANNNEVLTTSRGKRFKERMDLSPKTLSLQYRYTSTMEIIFNDQHKIKEFLFFC